jgi:hypothetical protein
VATCPKSVQVATFIAVDAGFELLNVMMVRVLRASGRLRACGASRPGLGGQLDAELGDEGAIECEFD